MLHDLSAALLDEKPKRREENQMIQSEYKFIDFNMNIGSNNTFSNISPLFQLSKYNQDPSVQISNKQSKI